MSRENRIFRACTLVFLAGVVLAAWTATEGPAFWLKLWILEAMK